jgi:hypothetical protein
VLAVGDDDLEVAGQPRQRTGAQSGTTVTDKLGTPRFIVALCCSTKDPARPASAPSTRSIAT